MPLAAAAGFTNVLRTACRRGSLPIALAQEIVDRVMQLPIATRDADLAEAAWAAGVGVMPG